MLYYGEISWQNPHCVIYSLENFFKYYFYSSHDMCMRLSLVVSKKRFKAMKSKCLYSDEPPI